MKEHNINNVTLLHQNFSSFISKEKFKVIISNPPYFATKDDNSKNLNIYLRNARHEEYLLLEDLCNAEFYVFAIKNGQPTVELPIFCLII